MGPEEPCHPPLPAIITEPQSIYGKNSRMGPSVMYCGQGGRTVLKLESHRTEPEVGPLAVPLAVGTASGTPLAS